MNSREQLSKHPSFFWALKVHSLITTPRSSLVSFPSKHHPEINDGWYIHSKHQAHKWMSREANKRRLQLLAPFWIYPNNVLILYNIFSPSLKLSKTAKGLDLAVGRQRGSTARLFVMTPARLSQYSGTRKRRVMLFFLLLHRSNLHRRVVDYYRAYASTVDMDEISRRCMQLYFRWDTESPYR